MTALSFYSINRFTALNSYSTAIDHSNQVIGQLYMLEGIVKDLDRIERGYMLTKDTSYQRQLLSTVEKITPAYRYFKLLLADNDVQRKNLVLVRSALPEAGHIGDNFAYMDTTRNAAISPYYDLGHQSMQESMKSIKDMQAEENT